MDHKAQDRAPYIEGHDIESSGTSDDESDDGAKARFVNPLLASKTTQAKKADESDEWSDESDDEDLKNSKKKRGDKKSLLGKRQRSDKDVDNVQDFFKNEQFDVVPADDPGAVGDGYDSMDSDEIAETRILARKMLRKKTRNEMIEASYNRFTTHEDPATLPSWFVEDEAKYRYQIHFAPTKEEMLAEKEAIKAYNARPSKKVEQAKMRKKKRLAKAMEKVKKKAQVIADTDLNEASKMK